MDRDEQVRELRNLLFWFWHDLGHFTAAIERGQLWWAAGQLEQLRHYCVSLIRIEQDVEVEDEPYWKLDTAMSTDRLDPLRSTFVPIDRDELVREGREHLAFFRHQAPIIARIEESLLPLRARRTGRATPRPLLSDCDPRGGQLNWGLGLRTRSVEGGSRGLGSAGTETVAGGLPRGC